MRRFLQLAFVLCVATGSLLAQSDTVYEAADGVTLPTIVRQVGPHYTSEAMKQRIEGVVQLSGVVRQNGHVTDVTIVESLDPVYGLDQSAVDAFKQWEFKPGAKDDKPVSVRITVQMKFTLK